MNTIANTNGADNASCPQCTHYNAMLGTGRYVDGERGRPQLDTEEIARQQSDQKEIYKCRDCGFEAFVEQQPEQWRCYDNLCNALNDPRLTECGICGRAETL